jgi:hypothetical protein
MANGYGEVNAGILNNAVLKSQGPWYGKLFRKKIPRTNYKFFERMMNKI